MNKDLSSLAPIDVRELMARLTVEELSAAAEQYFERMVNWQHLHAKPLHSVAEAPGLLTAFAQVIAGLELAPDMTILDFGAGSCWTSRFLTQLGLQVIALDVSPSALSIGQALYERYPPVGEQPPPRFLRFNGRRIELEDASVDRISCWDAFHHVPNPAEVIAEMARVLKDGGIAGFAEPGPEHSKSPQSQDEMRRHRVIENDIDVRQIRDYAQSAGFTTVKVAFFNADPFLLTVDAFDRHLDGRDPGAEYLGATREHMRSRRVFFLYKSPLAGAGDLALDSRLATGLHATLRVVAASRDVPIGGSARLEVFVLNDGRATWLPRTARIGGVAFGARLLNSAGELIDRNFYRHALDDGEPRAIAPGDGCSFIAEIPMLHAGDYIIDCDLVSEHVTWFSHAGSESVRVPVRVA